jgi:translation initiation factor eIF-2B subunit delta
VREGKQPLETLQVADIPSGYIQLNALTFVMKQVTKVILGASALMSNGAIYYGRVGTACAALLAKDNHIPVLVWCETYKISNKVRLESITQNELGNPAVLMEVPGGGDSSLANWKENKNLKLLINLMYDVTPPDFVIGIITEAGIIPPTSVAVLLREMNPQDAGY